MKYININYILTKLNQLNLFIELNPPLYPAGIIAGYTRSGTSYIGKTIADILGARYVYEPLCPGRTKRISFFMERESYSAFKNKKYFDAIKFIISPEYRSFSRDHGGRLIYNKGIRIMKLVRANAYLRLFTDIIPDCRILFLIRNPLGCVASRAGMDWEVPEQGHLYDELSPLLDQGQRGLLMSIDQYHDKMALSWVIDNIMALRNLNDPSFKFVFYEDLISSRDEFLGAICFIKKDYKADKSFGIHYRPLLSTIKKREQYHKTLGKDRVDSIIKIIDAFGLSCLYDFETGLPDKNGLEVLRQKTG